MSTQKRDASKLCELNCLECGERFFATGRVAYSSGHIRYVRRRFGGSIQSCPKCKRPDRLEILGGKMKKVCAAGETVKGLDVSHYQPTIDWAKVKSEGFEFAFLKATEGTLVTDPLYKKHRANAHAAGLLVGAYHFFHPRIDPVRQAEHFCQVMGSVSGELQPMFDWEVSDGVPQAPDRKAGLVFLNRVREITGKDCIIYGGPYFLDALKLTDEFAKYPLWVAHYGTKCPLVPKPWSTWTFHQWTDKGGIVGVAGSNEDADLFNGTLEQLKKFVS